MGSVFSMRFRSASADRPLRRGKEIPIDFIIVVEFHHMLTLQTVVLFDEMRKVQVQ